MSSELSCHEVVDLVTAYLEDALTTADRAEVDRHLADCEGCRTVLDQWRTLIDLSGRLTEDDVERLDPVRRDRLMSAFRNLRRR